MKIEPHIVSKQKVMVWHPESISQGFSISLAAGGWLEGSYDSIKSALKGAEHALKLAPKFFEMQKRVNHVDQDNRLITINDFENL